ncbi:MAG TPA: hypothetical protein VGG23_09425, partial [Acidimicrobiales bacterium]
RNTRDLPLYHMIFATDSKPGHNIMTHLYDQAAAEFPAMAQEARSLRARLTQEAQGYSTSSPPLVPPSARCQLPSMEPTSTSVCTCTSRRTSPDRTTASRAPTASE